MKPKYPTSVRLTDEAKALLLILADHSGVSMAAMLELLIRDRAKHDGVVYATESTRHEK